MVREYIGISPTHMDTTPFLQGNRPDLLIEEQFNRFAVEVKVGNDSSDIHDALPQLVNYWGSVVDGETNYTVKRVSYNSSQGLFPALIYRSVQVSY